MSESASSGPERTPAKLGPYQPNSHYETSETGRPLSHFDSHKELLPLVDGDPTKVADGQEAIVTALTDRLVPRLSDAKTPSQVEALIDDAAKQGLVSFEADGTVKSLNNKLYTRPNVDSTETKWTIDSWLAQANGKRQTLHEELTDHLASELGLGAKAFQELTPTAVPEVGSTLPEADPSAPTPEKVPGATGDEMEQAYAMKDHMDFAVGQVKEGMLDEARRSIALAHERAEAASTAHQERMAAAKTAASEAQRAIQAKIADGGTGTEVLKVFGDPVADAEMRDQLSRLIRRSAEPAIVTKHDNVSPTQRFTELVYSTSHNKLAYVERYTLQGQLLSRSLIATHEPAFTETRVRHRPAATKELAHALMAQEAALLPSTLDFSDQRKIARRDNLKRAGEAAVNTLANGANAIAIPGVSERTDTPDRPTSTYNPVVQRMESLGYDEATIGAVTRGKAGKPPRRRGFWGSLFGR